VHKLLRIYTYEIYAHTRACLLFERLVLITHRWLGIGRTSIYQEPSLSIESDEKPSRSRFSMVARDRVARIFERTRTPFLANSLGLFTNRSRMPDPDIWTTLPTINIQSTRSARRYKTALRWAGLTFSWCAPASADYVMDRSKRGRSPATCPRNNRRRSILDNTRRTTLSP